MRSKSTLVIDPSAAVSHAINSVLKKEGVTDLHIATSFKEADLILQRNKIEWIITSAVPSSGLSLLDYLTKLHQKNSTIRVSAFFQKEQLKLIPEAFALGLLSWHASFYSVQRIRKEIQTLFSRTENFSELDVAASYLGEYLTAIKCNKELVNLRRSLSSHDLEDCRRLLSLAEALFLNNEPDEAQSILARATYFDSSLTAQAIEIATRFKDQIKPQEKLNIVLIDGDDVSNAQVRAALAPLSPSIDVFHTADGVLPFQKEPDLILMEWKLRNLPGQKFVQRVRSANLLTPIVVISSSLSPDDERLARECSISRIVPKPFSKDELLSAVRWSLSQHRSPTKDKSIEEKVIGCLKTNAVTEAKRYLSQYKGNRLLYLEGALLFHQGLYKESNEKLIKYLKESRGERDVDAIAYLSKTLVELGANEAALALANKAFDMSPKNIERACDVANILYKIGNDKDAGIATEIAYDLDNGNQSVVKLVASKAILRGDFPEAKSLLSKLGDIDSVICIMNNKAVSLVKEGKDEQAEKLYKEVLKISPKESDPSRTVLYNLALHYARLGRNGDAETCLKNAMDKASKGYVTKEVYRKAYSLYQRLKGKSHRIPLIKGDDDEVSHLYLYELSDLIGNGRYRHLADKGICLGFVFVPLSPGEVDIFEPGDDFTISEDGLVDGATDDSEGVEGDGGALVLNEDSKPAEAGFVVKEEAPPDLRPIL